MILTLTPNPSLDLLFQAERLVWDDANRLPMPRRRPGGQGINLVRAVRVLDPAAETLAIAALGGEIGDALERTLRAEATPVVRVPIPADTRVFVGVRQTDGPSLLLNPRGPAVGAEQGEALVDAVARALDAVEAVEARDAGAAVPAEGPQPEQDAAREPGARLTGRPAWVACCGSLLPGLDPGLCARIARLARERGHRVVVDCDGEALRRAADAGCDLLVPNVPEAERLLGVRIADTAAAVAAAERLVREGTGMAVITRGAAGAVAATPAGVWLAHPVPPTAVIDDLAGGSAVGAGDAFLAALLLSLERDLEVPEALRRAVAAGTATLLGRGSDLIRLEDVERALDWVEVERSGRGGGT